MAQPPVILDIEEKMSQELVVPVTVGCCFQMSPVPLASLDMPMIVPTAAVRTTMVLKTKNHLSL